MVQKIRLTTIELRAVRRLVSQLAPIPEETVADPELDIDIVQPDELAELARRILRVRSRRTAHFKRPLFGEPAWEMLLVLYVHHSDDKRLSISQLTSFSGSPTATGLRWLDYLVQQKLVTRVPHPSDGRVVYIELTDEGRATLNQYLAEVRHLLR